MQASVALASLGAASTVALSGLGYGTLLPRPTSRRLPIEASWAIGLGALSSILFGLGSAEILTRGAIALIVGFGLVLLFVPGFRARLRQDRRPSRGAFAALTLFAPSLCLAHMPPTFFDSLVYHLTLPAMYLREGATRVHEESICSFFPQGIEMLFTAAMGLAGLPEAAAPLHVLLGALAALATASVAERVAPGGAVGLAAVLFASAPSVLMLAALPKNDLGIVLFVAVGIEAVAGFLEGDPPAPHGMLALGFALAAKYTAIYAVIALLAPATVIAAFRRRLPSPRQMALLLACLLLPALPWYLRSYLATGNPFYPAMPAVFGYAPFQRVGFLHPVERRELPLAGLLSVPFVVSFGGSGFGAFPYVGPLFFLLAPMALMLRARVRQLPLLLSFLALDIAFWWRSFNLARFLWPLLPVAAAFAAAGVRELETRVPLGRRYLRAALGLAIAANLASFLVQAEAQLEPSPYLLGREDRQSYLARMFPPYATFQAANHLVAMSGRILLVGETRALYLERPFVANSAYDLTVIVERVKAARDLQDLLQRLRGQGFTHVIFHPREMARLQRDYAPYLYFDDEREQALFRQFVDGLSRHVLYQSRGVFLCELPT